MSASRRRLIVNADDFGRTPGINAGIFAAHEEGIVTSATLMVGFDAAVDAAAGLSRHPGLGVGLHVTLTGGRPLLPPERLPSLVDADGRLPRRPDDRLAAASPSEVRAEVEAQLERFVELTGRSPTHLDSHHHSHHVPVVREVLVSLAEGRSLPVRGSSADVVAQLAARGVSTTGLFIDEFFGAGATLETLLRILDELPAGSTELMCHPARVDEELRRDSSYVDEREVELEALTHPDTVAAVERAGIGLIDFGGL